MRIRLRGPDGTSTISLQEEATVNELKSEIQQMTGITAFALKYGYPPKPLDLEAYGDELKLVDSGLKLDGEQLHVSAKNIAKSLERPLKDPPTASTPLPIAPGARSVSSVPPALPDKDPPEIAVPGMSGTLVLRVMPDDNSCLFRALSYAVLGDFDSMHELRGVVAGTIQQQADVYTEAVLEKKPDDYCRWISREDSWGGGIEISILSQHFNVEICSVNVQDLRVDRFNEGQGTRCILVYSGIHYDVIVLNPSSAPYEKANAPPELDQKIFASIDDAPLAGALDLCRILQKRHYYTDTAGFTVLCGDCGWQGTGETDAVKHAQQTGHYNFGEA